MTKLLVTILFSLTIISCEQKQRIAHTDKERIENVCDRIMQNFAIGKVSNVIQLLRQNSVMRHSSLDTLEMTIADQFKNILSAYGKIHSSEFIIEKNVKDFIASRLYILRFDRYYLKFDLTIYNTNRGWKIVSFEYNEELVDLF